MCNLRMSEQHARVSMMNKEEKIGLKQEFEEVAVQVIQNLNRLETLGAQMPSSLDMYQEMVLGDVREARKKLQNAQEQFSRGMTILIKI